jgi:DNA-binding NtrC family response regulator
MKILIVDDVQDYVNSLARALSDDYDIMKAFSLEEAKQKMDASVGLALIDVRLSEEDLSNRDGILLLAWLRENYPEVSVVMISAYRDFDSAVEALNLGAAYFLKKPINLRELKGIIASLTKKTI